MVPGHIFREQDFQRLADNLHQKSIGDPGPRRVLYLPLIHHELPDRYSAERAHTPREVPQNEEEPSENQK